MNYFGRASASVLLALYLAQIGAMGPSSAVGSGMRMAHRGAGSVKVRLSLEKATVEPGGRLGVRIENRGAEDIRYDYTVELSHFEHGGWVRLSTRPVFAPILNLPGESVSAWQYIKIPRQVLPGWFRVRKWVEVGSEARKRVPLMRTFRVAERNR